jgi:tetratricopeptide (TPR) repeat protein
MLAPRDARRLDLIVRNAALPDTLDLRYQAFLSYSHADVRWATWLHAKLEGFHLGDDLVGRETARGRIPNALRPIFRDRDEFAPGHSLSGETRVALDASAALIVICSPNAAKSHYVNEEIRLFKSRHADRLVIPLIVEDVQDHAEPQCFPPALAFKVASDGALCAAPEAILAADARKTGDGRDLALAKVVASLIGVPVDDVRKRQALTQTWWIKVTTAVVVTIAVLAMVAVFLGLENQRDRAQQVAQSRQIQGLADRLDRQAQGASTPGRKQAVAGAVEAAEKGAAAGDARLASALDLLKQGKSAEAEPLFRAVAEEREQASKVAEREAAEARANAEEREQASKVAGRVAAEAWRNLGAIAGLADPKRAREAYAHAVALDPENVSGMLQNGSFQQQAGQLDAAQDAYMRVITMTKPGHDDEALTWAQLGTGDIQGERGKLGAALAIYLGAEASANRLTKSDPDNAEWQRDLSVVYERIGDVQVASNLADALKSYRDSLAIRDRLAKSDPGNADRQRDLSVTYEKVGDVLRAQGDFAGAEKSYRDSLGIRDRLAKSDRGNAEWQRDLSVAYNKVGDVQVKQGDLAGAEKSYRDSLAIRDQLAKSDPSNAEWQRDLSVSYNRVGDVQGKQGDLAGAMKSHLDSLVIRKGLAKSDSGNALWQRDLSVSYDRVGDAQVKQGDLAGAEKSYRDSLAIRDRLAKSDRSNAEWQRDLSVSDDRVGDVEVKQGDLAGAEKSYRDSLAIRDRLAKSDPSNAEWQRDLAMSYDWVGDVQLKQDDLAGSEKSYLAGLAIRQALVTNGISNVQWQKELQFSIGRVGDLAFKFILTRDFDNALQCADWVISLAPDEVWLHTNRAHALMFLGREDEARTLYLRYRDEKNVLGKPWDTVILEDFAEMRKAGLMHPLMDEITKLFAR